MDTTALQLITFALKEIGVVGASQPASSSDAADGLVKLNARYDEWASEQAYAYNVGFDAYTLHANRPYQTIGPGGFFDVPIRPMRIESATIRLTDSSPQVDIPIRIVNDQWWANQPVKQVTSSVPIALYYSPDWPVGKLYYWPEPTVAYGTLLETWTVLQQITSEATHINLPPAYWNAIMLTLAEDLCGMFGKQVPALLPRKAGRARAALQSNNIKSPLTSTCDSGMSSSTARTADFNWTTGTATR